MPVAVTAISASFGAVLSVSLPLLGCVLVSKQTSPYPVGQAYFATYALVISDAWTSSSSPAALAIDFVFDAEAEKVPHAGLYCLKPTFNGQFSPALCQASDLVEITVFHLPANPHDRLGKPCNIP